MRLPHYLVHSPFFVFSNEKQLIAALGQDIKAHERDEIIRLAALKLPPITSENALATMIGVNPGIVWAMIYKHRKYYNKFCIRSRKSYREIVAPRVGLKIIQKWVGANIASHYCAPDIVFGFVSGRSHIDAAAVHCEADWVYEFDIESFFSTTPESSVVSVFEKLGYTLAQAQRLAKLSCYSGFLAQGAPSSPTISNFALSSVDEQLELLARDNSVTVTRYADDIVFSGKGAVPDGIRSGVYSIFEHTPWKLARRKEHLQKRPARLKVYGLLVDRESPRLTKGYRNKIRAYDHMLARKSLSKEDARRLRGHINFAKQVAKRGVRQP